MPIPEITMSFDEHNLATFIKELLSLEENSALVHNRFDSKIVFKCKGSITAVRLSIAEWLLERLDRPVDELKSDANEQNVRDKLAQFLDSRKDKEEA